MRRVGTIVEWNDERGFGFVVPDGGGDRAFLHISAFDRRGDRPFDGALVSYEVDLDERKRPQARAVRFVNVSPRPSSGGFPWRAGVGILVLAVLGAGYVTGRLPMLLAGTYGAASLVAFAMYWIDKSAARNDRWRTPESKLHVVGLLGGWPGALLAQDVFRHKSRKVDFQIVFWIVVIANVAIVVWLMKSGNLRVMERALRALH